MADAKATTTDILQAAAVLFIYKEECGSLGPTNQELLTKLSALHANDTAVTAGKTIWCSKWQDVLEK